MVFSVGAFAQLSAPALPALPACAPGSWYAVTHSSFDYAYRWCDDTNLLVGFVDVANPTLTQGMHIRYAGVTHGVSYTGGVGFHSLIFGTSRTASPRISTPASLKFKMWGSNEHGCGYDPADPGSPNHEYDHAIVEVSALRVGGNIKLSIDVEGAMYLLFPANGVLTTVEDSGATLTQAVSSMVATPPHWFDLASAAQASSLGPLGIEMHTDTAGEMHFQKHSDLLEVDFDHICEHVPLPPKPELTLTTRIVVERPWVEKAKRQSFSE